jgi:hypothetical protein
MDEGAIFSGPFIFISYSHRNAEIVREDAEKLIARGVRVWIDHRSDEIENMHLSDNWFQKVKTAVLHPNCRGVVFYISAQALLSRAIRREQKLVRDTEGLPYYCVSIGGVPVSKHLRKAVLLSDDEESEWYDPDYYGNEDAEGMQKEMFHDDKLAIIRADSDECVRQIYNKIALPLGATDDEGAMMAALKKSSAASKDTETIRLGIYKGARCEPVSRVVENSRFTFMDRHYIHHNGEFFTSRPLRWKLLYIKDSCAALICSEILEKEPFTEVEEYLRVFANLAFSPAEAKVIRSIRLLDERDEEQIDPARRDEVLALPAPQENMYWWTNKIGVVPQWRLTYRNNKPIPNGFLVTQPKGFRPVIEVGVDDLKNTNGGSCDE